MRNNRRSGGLFRLILILIVLLAAAAVIRFVPGMIVERLKGKNAAVQTSEQTGSAEGSRTGYSGAAGADNTAAGDNASAGENTAAAANSDASAASTAVQAAGADADVQSGAGAADESGLSGLADTSAAAVSYAKDAVYNHAATELEEGRAYLASLEERTPVEMEVMIEEARTRYQEEQRREEYSKKREEYRNAIAGDNLWPSFDDIDFVFLGDPRVIGFDIFGFLPSERILAGQADTINSITDRLDEVRSLSPDYIFISYGINDLGIGYWPTPEEYAEAFSNQLTELQTAVPKAQIFVNSILPAKDNAVDSVPVWSKLPDYSEAVRLMCANRGISFINNASLVEEHGDLYDPDGVHLQPDFYRYWAENQLLGIYDRENGHLTF